VLLGADGRQRRPPGAISSARMEAMVRIMALMTPENFANLGRNTMTDENLFWERQAGNLRSLIVPSVGSRGGGAAGVGSVLSADYSATPSTEKSSSTMLLAQRTSPSSRLPCQFSRSRLP
jgi:hypothetical protein